jgi:NTE family protein
MQPGQKDSSAGAAAGGRLGLAFGGGLPFGLVALGVLRVFEEERIPVHRLAGTSMGSVIAATYAARLSIDECIERFAAAFNKKRMLAALLRDLSFSGRGILRGQEVVHLLESFIGRDRTFEDLLIPLRIPACDLADGTEVVFASGPLIPAIRASISLPGIFAPFVHDGRQLVDGALLRPIPVHLLGEDEVDVKIPVRAVRLRSRTQLHDDVRRAHAEHRLSSRFTRQREDLFTVMWRAMSLIMQDEFAEMIFDDFDVYIKPKLDLDLSRDPSRLHEIVQAGYDETRRTLPAIRAALEAAATPRPRRARRKRGSSAADLDAEIED